MARRVAWFIVVSVLAAGPAGATEGTWRRSGLSEALLGRWERALTRLEGADRASRYYRAVALLNLGRREEAFAGLRALSESAGAFAGPALEVAVETLFRDGQYVEVLDWAATSRAEQFQDEDTLHYRLGQSRYLTGDVEGAARDLEGVSAPRNLPYALHTLALIHFAGGRIREAVSALGAALEASEKHPDADVRAALAARLLLTRGRVLYQAAVSLSGLEENSRQRLFALARRDFERVPPQSPDYPEALRGIGWTSAELGDAAGALGAFQVAAARDPASAQEDLWAQGRVYQRVGFYDEAARLYGEAQEAATAAAKSPAAEIPATGAGRRWRALQVAAAAARRRTDELETLTAEIEGALAARAARLTWIRDRVGSLRTGNAAREDELGAMAGGLKDYMDRIPALALFPPAERPRLESLAALQDRLGLDVARAQAAFSRLGDSSLWRDAPADLRERGRILWARLEASGVRLAQAQLAFLETVKQRGSKREKELETQIAELRVAAAKLVEPVGGLEAQLAEARARQDERGERLRTLTARLAAVEERLGSVEQGAVAGLNGMRNEAAAAASRHLGLRADTMALDETEALHLWMEKGREARSP